MSSRDLPSPVPVAATGFTFVFVFVFVVAAALAAVLFPLATYALTLAVFGLVHVVVELRYVDRRFSSRVPWRLGTTLLLVLGAIVLVRLLGLAAMLGREPQAALELGLVGALVLLVLPVLRRVGGLRALVGLALLGLLVFGALRAPLPTLVLFAVLHNLTPVGFLADALEGRARRRALLLCALVFGLVPLGIASGLPARALAGWSVAGFSLPDAGRLDANLGVFVPSFWQGGVRAVDLFSAAVYLQCLHYAVVIHVLPRLAPGPETKDAGTTNAERIPWPAPRAFAVGLAGVAAVSFAAFFLAFSDARAVYGLFALAHAWIEIPVLLLALAVRPGG